MSQSITKSIISPFLHLMTNSAYRRFIQLYVRYGGAHRYTRRDIRFGRAVLTVVDPLSALFQYKEIYVGEYYKFTASQPDPRIIDCGANIGMSVLYFKSLYPQSRITAYEADPEIAGVLQGNVTRNGLSGVDVVPKAVWTHSEGITFFSDGADGGSLFGSAQKKNVASVRLADVLRNESKVDLLKMDIEGAETDVMTDCSSALSSVDRIYLEYHAWKGAEQNLDRILEVLKNAGFRYFIQSVSELRSPLFGNRTIDRADLQLHIFATHARLHSS